MTASIRAFRATRTLFTILALFALVASIAPRPASAEGAASTRNIILGAAAAVAGIVIYDNVRHKRAAANQVVGYTRDGGTVHADGRVTYPNGRTYYTSNGDGRVCGYGYGNACNGTPVVYRSREDDERDRWRSDRGDRGWHGRRHDDDRRDRWRHDRDDRRDGDR